MHPYGDRKRMINKVSDKLRFLYRKNRLSLWYLKIPTCNAIIQPHLYYGCTSCYSNLNKKFGTSYTPFQIGAFDFLFSFTLCEIFFKKIKKSSKVRQGRKVLITVFASFLRAFFLFLHRRLEYRLCHMWFLTTRVSGFLLLKDSVSVYVLMLLN